MKAVKTVHYCKADKKTGKPVIVTDLINDKRTNVKKWSMDLFDKSGKPVRVEVEFENAVGRAKRQGATTMLKVIR